MKHRFGALFLCLVFSSVQAENLYLQMVKDSKPSVNAIKKATKQLKQHKEIKILDNLSVSPFHLRITEAESKGQPLCRTCHQRLPHKNSVRSRTFLNMHSDFIACESCHFKPKGVVFDFHWVAYSEPWVGEKINTAISIHTEADKFITSIKPRSDAFIAPYFANKPAFVLNTDPYSQEIEKTLEKGTLKEKIDLQAKLHQLLSKKARKCFDCHSDKSSILNLKQLGANESQQRAIRHNIVTRFFKRYKKDDERLRLIDLLR